MAIKLSDVKEGSVVTVRQNFGRGPVVKGRVDEVESDIKNGYPGIGYTIIGGEEDGEGYWAYLEDVVKVISK